jgi:hypothetical protein
VRVLVDQSGAQNRAGLGLKIQERVYATYNDRLSRYFLDHPDATVDDAFTAVIVPSEFPWEGVSNPLHRAGRRACRGIVPDWDFEPAPMPTEIREQIAAALPNYRREAR